MNKYPYISENKCLNCGGEITIKRSRDKNNKYCCTSCVGKHLRSKIKEKSICLNCGKEFENRYGKNLFCNRECQIKYNKRHKKIYIRVCKKCGKIFYPNQINYVRNNNIYCSSECSKSVRKYNFDQNYFNIIDTEEKAYWLGFIYADGNVYRTTFTLKLNIKDESHIKIFMNHIKGEQPIKYYSENCCYVNITSKRMIKQLNDIGVMPRKTFKIELPKLRYDLYNDFIRGYFDGDGCIYVTNKYHTFSMYTASKSFKNSIKNFFKNELKIDLNEYGNNLSKSKISDLIKIYNFLYDKPNIVYLDRKKEKFDYFLLNTKL